MQKVGFSYFGLTFVEKSIIINIGILWLLHVLSQKCVEILYFPQMPDIKRNRHKDIKKERV